MRLLIFLFLVSVCLISAHSSTFSIYDDLLAFPQYVINFSKSAISDDEASFLLSQKSPASRGSEPSKLNNISPQQDTDNEDSSIRPMIPLLETYELLYLQGIPHLCAIPVVSKSPRNETSERNARAAERQELARATERAWELLQGLEGSCLYFVSGWWSYSFCFNSEVTQFHHLTLQPGKQEIPKRDPTTKQFILGRASPKEDSRSQSRRQANGLMDVYDMKQSLRLELQHKGGTRYLVQKMESGTICDLTNKPRRIEVQFHCNPSLTDRIGYIKEITTCSYLMVVYTPRLCSDVAFLPPKENIRHTITCRMVVPEKELAETDEPKTPVVDDQVSGPNILKENEKPKIVGGILVGGGKWIKSESQRLLIPEIFGDDISDYKEKAVEIIAQAKSKAEGGQVEVATDADLKKLDLDPVMIDKVRLEIQKLAKEKGWKIEIVDAPGQTREVLGIVDGETDDTAAEEELVEVEDEDEEEEEEDIKNEL